METFIYRETQFRKRLSQLSRAGGKEAQVARRVEGIIERSCMRNGSTEEFGKMTGHGEARVEKCRKLNLGAGYRLLYFNDRSRAIFAFVGTHDECDRWLTHNAGFEAVEADAMFRVNPDPEEDPRLSGQRFSAEDEDDYESALMEKIDDKTLQRIFRGFVHRRD